MKLCDNSKKIISKFKHIKTFNLSNNLDDGKIELFLFPINSRNFDYDLIVNVLLESVAEYSLSSKTRSMYKDSPMKLSIEARRKFRKVSQNNGELGELFLFCFLEGHLEAPKILTKLEKKTSADMYVNGSDGVHLKKISKNRYKLIFGESKMYKDAWNGLKKALESINEFNNGKENKGIVFEKGLIESTIDELVFSENDMHVLDALIYPNKYENNKIKIDDAFAIFLGFEVDIEYEQENFDSVNFEKEIKKKIIDNFKKYTEKIYEKIKKYKLIGHTFYIYVLPFTDIDNTRKNILENILS